MKKLFKKGFDFYVFSNIHVALAAVSLTFVSYWNLGEVVRFTYLLWIFIATLVAYHFIRVFVQYYFSLSDLSLFKNFTIFDFLLFLVGMVLFFKFVIESTLKEILILLPAVILTIWYAVPIVKIYGKPISLRRLPQFKIFVIVLVWNIGTLLLPLHKHLTDYNLWIEWVQRTFLLMALTIPFDIRDFESDPQDMSTLPQKMGIQTAKKVSVLLMVGFFMLIFFKTTYRSEIILSECIVFAVSLGFVTQVNNHKSIYYTAFWMEGIPILWALLLWGLEMVLY